MQGVIECKTIAVSGKVLVYGGKLPVVCRYGYYEYEATLNCPCLR